jgi:uncharacterized protein YbaP (TraB family)
VRLALLFLSLVACRGEPESRRAPVAPAKPPAAAAAPAPMQSDPRPAAPDRAAAGGAPTADPWATPAAAPSDQPPTLVQRHRFAETHCPRVVHPFYFAVEKNKHTSYLLGTRHASVALAKMPEAVRARVRTSKLAVFEVAPDDHGSIAEQNIDLRAALGDELWRHYRDLVGSEAADAMRVGSPVTANILMLALFEDLSATLDLEIEHAVADQGIPARGLETSIFQDTLLARLLDVRALRASVSQTKDRHELEQDASKDLEQYCQGADHAPGTDAKGRAHMKAAGYSDAEIDALDDELVFARNRSWIPKLEELFRQDDVLVVVGADHLLGSKGVPALLAQRGYHVTRLDP